MTIITIEQNFTEEIIGLIQKSKQNLTVTVNAELTLLYWHIGERIANYILQGERADYGKQLIPNLAKVLTEQFGNGWNKTHLGYCLKLYQEFQNIEIFHALRGKLSWTYLN